MAWHHRHEHLWCCAGGYSSLLHFLTFGEQLGLCKQTFYRRIGIYSIQCQLRTMFLSNIIPHGRGSLWCGIVVWHREGSSSSWRPTRCRHRCCSETCESVGVPNGSVERISTATNHSFPKRDQPPPPNATNGWVRRNCPSRGQPLGLLLLYSVQGSVLMLHYRTMEVRPGRIR